MVIVKKLKPANKKSLKKRVNHTAHHALNAPAETVHLSIHAVKRGHQLLVGTPHHKLRQRIGWYDRWHNYKHHNKVHMAVLSLHIVLMFGLMIGLSRVASAFDSFVQTDWSAGVGTSTVNQYSAVDNLAPASGSVAIGATDNASSWCATANCDSSWGNRKLVSIHNGDSQDFNNFQVLVKVDFATGMKSDFSDIRFTNQAGNIDLSYFVQQKINSQSADVLVKLPSLPRGDNTIYLYYGNSGANSLSDVNNTMDFTDHFNSDPSPYWSAINGNITVGGGQATIGQGNAMYNVPPYNLQDNTTDRVLEYDYTIDLSSLSDCTNYTFGNYSKLAWDPTQYPGDPDAFTLDAIVATGPSAPCGNNAEWTFSDINIAHHNDIRAIFDTNSLPHIKQGDFIRVRLVSKAAGGFELYISTDGGNTFIQLPIFTPNNQQYKVGAFFSAEHFPVTVRNIDTYKRSVQVSTAVGTAQWQAGRYGTLSSSTINMGTKAYFGKVGLISLGGGTTAVRLRTSTNADMSGAASFDQCNDLQNNDDVSSSKCVAPNQPYMQYQLVVSDSGTHDSAISSVLIEHLYDPTPPDNLSSVNLQRAISGQVLAPNGAWVNAKPYVSWPAGVDNPGGSGIAGYCIGLTDGQPNPDGTTSGMINEASPANSSGLCQYAINGTALDINSLTSVGALTNGHTYYLAVRPYDKAGNISPSATVVSFGYDTDQPIYNTITTFPPAVTNTKIVSTSWQPMAPAGDDTSGVAGVKYCVSSAPLGFGGCGMTDSNWYGKNHTSGQLNDTSDIIPYDDGVATTVLADASRLDDNSAGLYGIDQMFIALVDNAGNAIVSPGATFLITQHASGPVNNLAVNPATNTNNSFSFTWDPPSLSFGGNSTINYCWSVNTLIAPDGSNCHWTGQGITQLASGAYATKQGVNTMYVSSRDLSGNFDGTQYASVEFSVSTMAPTAPTDLDIADVSVRATSTWKTALSWNEPNQSPVPVDSYKVFRSTDNVTFAEVGSTSVSNLSFIDSGLSQQTYYYQVRACDDAGSCSAPSDTVSKLPTGRYTSPPRLTSDQNQPRADNVGNRTATIVWFTDRVSDSKVALGTASGQYSPGEIGSSNQVTNHVVQLTNLQPGTTYYFVCKWSDLDGNLGISREVSFTTLPAPSISMITTTNINVDKATTDFTITNGAQAKIYYGKSDGFGSVKTINTSTQASSYSIVLDGLDDGTKYFYKINSVDLDGNEYDGNINAFTTLVRPHISNMAISAVDNEPSSTQKISWDTNVASSTEVVYGPLGAKAIEQVATGTGLHHEIIIRGLEDDTEYSLSARSRDDLGNVVLSEPRTFHTALDTRPPDITDVNIEVSVKGVGSEARGQIVVSWKTDEPATSAVAYGIGDGNNFTNRTNEDDKLTMDHTVVISDLAPSNVYHLQTLSSDKAHNLATGDTQSAIVGRATDSIFSIILNALRRIFGFAS